MQGVIDVITKIFDFLEKQDYAKIFDTVEKALIKVVEWIGTLGA